MKKYVKIVLTIFFVSATVIISVGKSFGIFFASKDGNGTINIAKFIVNHDLVDSLQLNFQDIYPGNENEFNYTVSFCNDQTKTDVNINYRFLLKTGNIVPLTFELYDNERLLENISCNNNSCTSNTYSYEFKNDCSKEYILKIKYPESYNNINYSGVEDYIELSIDSKQV